MLFGKKLLLIESNVSCSCYASDYCDCTPDITIRELDSDSDIRNLITSEPDRHSLVDTLIEDPSFQLALKAKGWINFHNLKGQQEKVKFQERFFIASGMKSNHSYSTIREVDLSKLSEYEARQLADKEDASLFQKITTTSLKDINPKAYAAYLKESKKKKVASERAKKAAETRKRKKKEKEIAKAKKLLEEAGELED